MRKRMGWLLGAVVTVTACSGAADPTITISSPTSTVPIVTSTTEAVTTTTGETTTSIAAATTTTASVDVTVQAGEVDGPERISFAIADEVSVWVLADIDDQIHVHGYDIYYDTEAGIPVEIAFTADVPGIFEVELESSHLPLFELEVTS